MTTTYAPPPVSAEEAARTAPADARRLSRDGS